MLEVWISVLEHANNAARIAVSYCSFNCCFSTLGLKRTALCSNCTGDDVRSASKMSDPISALVSSPATRDETAFSRARKQIGKRSWDSGRDKRGCAMTSHASALHTPHLHFHHVTASKTRLHPPAPPCARNRDYRPLRAQNQHQNRARRLSLAATRQSGRTRQLERRILTRQRR
jgi:hypothetical protein